MVKWPGSVNDAVIWDNCGFNEKLQTFFDRQSKEYQGWLLGDSRYAQRPNMIVPYLEPDTSGQESYNRSHKMSRCLIEGSFGCLKSRFRCLCKNTSGAIMFEPEVACSIIISCMILHNNCMDRNFPATWITADHQVQSPQDQITPPPSTNSEAGFRSRQALVEKHF